MTEDLDKQGIDVLREVQVKTKWRTLVFKNLGFINDFQQEASLTEGQSYHVVWKEVSKEKDGKLYTFKNMVSIEPDSRQAPSVQHAQEGPKDAQQSKQTPLVDYHTQKADDILRGQCLNAAARHMTHQVALDPVLLVRNAKLIYEECKKQEFP